MRNSSFPAWPRYEPDEIAAVTRVLESGRVNYWTGDEGRKFEQEFAAHHGAEYGVAVPNGTVALDLALLAFGANWRLTEMQSAMGRVQLGKLDQWIAKRRENARVLIEGLSGVPVPDAHVGHAWYKFYAYVEPERLKAGWSRDAVMEAVSGLGVPCMQGICPEVYLEKAFEGKVKGESAKGGGQRAGEQSSGCAVYRI